MKIACASDAHRAYAKEEGLIDRLPRVDAFCFLGDMDDDADCLQLLLEKKQPHAPFYAVAGNNDPFSRRPRTLTLCFGELRAMLTHGHLFRTRQAMAAAAASQGCQLLLYGHSHKPLVELIDGVHVVNPGTLRSGQWALVDVQDPPKVQLLTL
ncbi:MAG: YfcE family phosphodiesterase [Firmicutes bacterium]|nr:YfcE family phosphodiesterase [Bacillota bacterium]